jgi:hypothetical protein
MTILNFLLTLLEVQQLAQLEVYYPILLNLLQTLNIENFFIA